MDPTLTTVVFDIGGVLLDWNPRYLYSQVFREASEVEYFLENICTHEWHHRHNLGEDVQESCERLAALHPEYREMIMAWGERGEEMVSGQIDEVVSVLDMVKSRGYRSYALSNMERCSFLARRTRFEFFDWFDGCVISGFEGVAKPERQIFDILFARYQVEPARSIFIDDSVRNIDMARSLGMRAIQYESPSGLTEGLAAYGLPVSSPGG